MERKELINKVKEVINSFDKNAKVILFGSRARGDFNKSSDWDFLVLLESPISIQLKRNIRNNLTDIELEAEAVINTLIHSKNDWKKRLITPLHKNIDREGLEI